MAILYRSGMILVMVLVLMAAALAVPVGQELTDPVAISNIGYHAYQDGRIDLAEKLFLKAIDLDPAYERARMNLAVLYNGRGEYGLAANQLLELTRLDATNVQYWYDLGANQIADFRFGTGVLNDFYAGIASYERAAAIDPGYAHVRENLAVLYRIKAEFGL